MKKMFALLLALSMCLLVFAVPAAATATTDSWRDELTTVTEGKLTVATSPDFAPYEFYAIDENGTPTLSGFDMDLAKYMADYMGLELEIVTVDFDGVLSELQTKSVDLGMAGLSPSAEREAIMDFSEIYYQGGQAMVTSKAYADEIKSMEDANKADYTIGAQTGSIQLELANTNTPDAAIVSMPKVTDIISELLSGKEQAAFVEMDVALCYQKNYPDLVVVCEVPYDTKGSAIGVCKGNAPLLAAVNDAITASQEDGSMEQFVAEAVDLAAGDKYEGLLEDGAVPGQEGEEAPDEAEEESGNAFVKAKNFATVAKYKDLFVQGVIVTILLSVFTVLIGFVLALMLALMRMSDFRPLRFLSMNKEGFEEDTGILSKIGKFNPLSFLATAYVEIIRSTPVLVQIFIIYYGVFSMISLPSFTLFGFLKFERFFPGIVALGINSGAYLCEIIRSGIQSVDGGQTEAARSLGMSQIQNLRFIILPQALKNILPAIANEFVVIIKESSITYTIGVQDIMSAVNAVKGAAFVITEPLLVATAIYFCLCFPTSKVIAYFERRMSRGDKR